MASTQLRTGQPPFHIGSGGLPADPCAGHVSTQVLFAICHDKEPLAEVVREAGKAVSVTTTAAGGVTWEVVDDGELQPADGADSQPRRKLRITIPKWCGKWVVGMDSFADGVVGAKSKNLAGADLPVAQLAATQMID